MATMSLSKLSNVELASLSIIDVENLPAEITAALDAIKSESSKHSDAKNVYDDAKTQMADAKGGVWARCLDIVLYVRDAVPAKSVHAFIYERIMGEMLHKDYPSTTVRAYGCTGRAVLEKLSTVDAQVLRDSSYKEIRELLNPKGAGMVQLEALKKQISDDLGYAVRHGGKQSGVELLILQLEELAAQAASVAGAVKAVKEEGQTVTKAARAINEMRTPAESPGVVATDPMAKPEAGRKVA